jgi:L-rhamnose mutarotase
VNDANLIAAYEAAHAPGAVWPEIIAGIREKGFLDMEIWRVEDRLLMVAEVSEAWPIALPEERAIVDARWEKAMDIYQRPLPGSKAGEKWRPMTKIFALGDQ